MLWKLDALWFGGWLLINEGVIAIVAPWDPYPFVMLALIASVEAICLSRFVLITQNRMQRVAERRAVFEQIAMHVGIDTLEVDLNEVREDVRPQQVAREIQKTDDESLHGS